jgi:malonyl CoA-acyl carrier protein transacylase
MLSEGYNRIYEIGPSAVLTGLMRHILRANPQFTDVQIEKLVL